MSVEPEYPDIQITQTIMSPQIVNKKSSPFSSEDGLKRAHSDDAQFFAYKAGDITFTRIVST